MISVPLVILSKTLLLQRIIATAQIKIKVPDLVAQILEIMGGILVFTVLVPGIQVQGLQEFHLEERGMIGMIETVIEGDKSLWHVLRG